MAFNENTKLGDLLDNESTKAVLEKNLPGISTHPMIHMGRGFTLGQLASIPQANLSQEKVMAIVADLAGIED